MCPRALFSSSLDCGHVICLNMAAVVATLPSRWILEGFSLWFIFIVDDWFDFGSTRSCRIPVPGQVKYVWCHTMSRSIGIRVWIKEKARGVQPDISVISPKLSIWGKANWSYFSQRYSALISAYFGSTSFLLQTGTFGPILLQLLS
jgi:hypothetical protein